LRIDLRKVALGASLSLLLGGCAAVGPDFNGPPKAPILSAMSRKSAKDPHLASWWKIYRDPVLDRLVRLAWRQNLDLQAAGLRIMEARAALGVAEGMDFPQMQKLSGSSMVSNGTEGQPRSRSETMRFDMGWELDLWGKYARMDEAARSGLFAAVYSYNDLLVSVIAEVARSYIAYRTAQERIAYAERNIAIEEYVLKVTKIRFNAGNVSELDMQQAKTQLHSTKAMLYELELSKIRARNALAMLLGIAPDRVERYLGGRKAHDDLGEYLTRGKETLQINEAARSLHDIGLIPMPRFDPRRPIDAELITRRPDVKMAEYLAHQRSAEIGMATADLYPSFSLLGTIGYNLNPLFYARNISVVAGPSFAWNILQYGRIRNNIRLKDARFEESLVAYNKTVLKAFHEISYALDSYRYTRKELQENRKAVEASVRAFNLSMKQYRNGLVSYQRLLNSVEKLTRYQDQYARLKGAMATEVAALYKALGGGWQLARGGRYLSETTVKQMKERTDWGRMLESAQVRLPKDWQ
jgi:outer membrane protein TolC